MLFRNDIETEVVSHKKTDLELKQEKFLSYKTHFFYISKRLLLIMKGVPFGQDELHMVLIKIPPEDGQE